MALKNIKTAGTTLVTTGQGSIASITLNNNAGISGTQTIAIYDGVDTSGVLLGTIGVTSATPPVNLPLWWNFKVGVCIVTSGTNDLTVNVQ